MRAEVDKVFDMYDKDKDGKLDVFELRMMLNEISRKKGKDIFTVDEVRYLMSNNDSSGDITLEKD